MKKGHIYEIIITILILLIIGLGVFLYYQKTNYDFILNGSDKIVLFNGDEYEEQGYFLIDHYNNNLSDQVVVEKDENEIKYLFQGKIVGTRNIKRIDFYLNGEEEIFISVNDKDKKYEEKGCVAKDNTGKDYSQNITTIGEVNLQKIGVYEIKYVLKIDDYEKTLVRKVELINLVGKVKLDKEALEMKINETATLKVTIEPENADNKAITWKSSNEKIATVTNGEIKALAYGEVDIEATTNNGKKASCHVKVNKLDDAITITEVQSVVSSNTVAANVKSLSNLPTTVKYYTDASCTKETSVPKEIGTYYVIAQTSGSELYNAFTSKCSKAVIISKASVALRIGTLNIGGYGCGTGGLNCSSTSVSSFAKVISNANVDIMGVQEAEPTSRTTSVAKSAGLNYTYFRQPASANGILSKYSFKSTTYTDLKKCMESRVIQKVVINVNGVDISVYNTHFSYQPSCLPTHFSHAAEIIKNDPNPTIIVADFNAVSINYYNTYFKPIGFEIAAYDNNWHNAKTNSYCDAVFINRKGHIDFVKSESFLAYGVVSDHNLVVATVNVY